MVTSGIANTNINCPYLARSPIGDLNFAATSSFKKKDMSRMERSPRRALKFASTSSVQKKDASTMGKSSRRSLEEDDSHPCVSCDDGSIPKALPAAAPSKTPVGAPSPFHKNSTYH
ncbi:unnamed protein product [Musa textilis]